MATQVLRAHNVILPQQRRVRAGHQKPNPAARKHQGSSSRNRKARGPAVEVYAGPAFSTSPEPSSLPLPQFPVKKPAAATAAVDDAATRDLRRILRLE